ncbi:MAG: hypothetical protein JST82_13845 [Bacteroidetes bacterium]|nr:hypothetical protein [Bacteroidota bacterium]
MPLKKTILSLTYVLAACIAHARPADSLLVSVDPMYSRYQQAFQPINYQIPDAQYRKLRLSCYQQTDSSSKCLYDIEYERVLFEKGIHQLLLDFDKNSKINDVSYEFIALLKRFEFFPPGRYTTRLWMQQEGTGDTASYSFEWNIDSALAYRSGLRNDINSSFTKGSHKNSNAFVSKTASNVTNPAQLAKTRKLFERRIDKQKGITSVSCTYNNQASEALYYKGFFLGFYPVAEPNRLQKQIAGEEQRLGSNPSSFVNLNLPNAPSVNSRFKQFNNQQKKEDETTEGNIDLSGNFSTGQEPNSMQDNNFQEIRGDIHTEIKNIPVIIEGYYTTQDQHRKAKASYFRFRYDVDKYKKKLRGSVSSYKNSYEDTKAKGSSFNNIAQIAIAKLRQEKAILLDGLRRDYGITEPGLNASGCNMDQLLADSAGKKVAKIKADQADICNKYNRIISAEKKIAAYQHQVDQYNKQDYFDKELSYNKIKDIANNPNASNKQLASAAKYILPQSGPLAFMAGFTKIDGGILNSYESSYTMSGQTLKGGSIGYELNVVKVGLSAGKTEYISRDGNVDRYNTYLARLDFKKTYKQQFSLIYFGYTPTKQILDDPQFKKTDAYLPTFQQPVHILSLTHTGTITKDLSMESEGAVSYKNSANGDKISNDNAAYKTALEYQLPKINSNLKGEWEHVGKNFENNAMPYTKAATERYTLAGQTSLFKSFLLLGVQWNRVKQQSFSSSGYNTRWGFDLQTKSKQYPNIYLSYKPYSTFRKYDDTLAIAQRPVFGEVWIARATYQFKRGKAYHRFMLSYNSNKSTMDTLTYKSQTIQAGYIYTDKTYTISNTAGWMKQPLNSISGLSYHSSVFTGASAGFKLNQQLTANIGQDIAVASYGIQRYTATAGMAYSFMKLPFRLHIQARYSSLHIDETVPSRHIWYGQIGINWRFKTQAF